MQGHSPFEEAVDSKDVDGNNYVFKESTIFSEYESDCNLTSFKSYQLTSDGFVVVYTDGSCVGNGRSNSKAGIGVYFGPESVYNVSMKLPSAYEPTNNTAELYAVLIALKQCKSMRQQKIEVRSDSKFLLECVTRYIPTWQKNGWIKTNKKAVKHKVELMELAEEMRGLTIRWVHIPGHSSDPRIKGNDYADFLAKMSTQYYFGT